MSPLISRLILLLASCFLAITQSQAASGLNLPYGVTPISHEVYKLHMAAFYICCVIGAIVFSVLIYSLIKFRKSKGAQPVHFHEHLGVEILWTTIPFLILVGLAIPATIVLKHIHNTDASGLTVKVIGYQWRWKYEYLDQGLSFFSTLATTQDQINNKAPKGEWYLLEVDKPMVIPINTKVKLLVTADDVIHSWWVPDFGIKQDGVPGFVNENWIYVTEPGTYRGQCGELCGVNHGFMPVVVKAVTQAEFVQWVAAEQKSAGISGNQYRLSENKKSK
jgi:cytochrome c oxidase subunit 2